MNKIAYGRTGVIICVATHLRGGGSRHVRLMVGSRAALASARPGMSAEVPARGAGG